MENMEKIDSEVDNGKSIWIFQTKPESYKENDIKNYIKVLSNNEFKEDFINKKKKRIRLLYKIKLQYNPITRTELKNISGLENMEILKVARHTNFRVLIDEWRIISNLIKKKLEAQ